MTCTMINKTDLLGNLPECLWYCPRQCQHFPEQIFHLDFLSPYIHMSLTPCMNTKIFCSFLSRSCQPAYLHWWSCWAKLLLAPPHPQKSVQELQKTCESGLNLHRGGTKVEKLTRHSRALPAAVRCSRWKQLPCPQSCPQPEQHAQITHSQLRSKAKPKASICMEILDPWIHGATNITKVEANKTNSNQ